MPHSNCLPVPVFTRLPQLSPQRLDGSTSGSFEGDSTTDPEYAFINMPRPLNQKEMNDLVRDLSLLKENAELLSSRLREKNLVRVEVRVTFYRKRHEEFSQFFTKTQDLVFCNNIRDLLLKLGIKKYTPQDWRLFIDSCKRSLKCVLLHNGNLYASIPIAHSTTLKEKYEEIKMVLEKICYEQHKWVICVDLKMVNFLLGQQSGYTKLPCFICLGQQKQS